MGQARIGKRAAAVFVLAVLGGVGCENDEELSGPPPAACEPVEVAGPRAENTFLVNVDPTRLTLTAKQQRILASQESAPWTEEVHVARLASDFRSMLGEGREIGIDVSPTEHYVIIIERKMGHKSANDTWWGSPRHQSDVFVDDFSMTLGSRGRGYGDLRVNCESYGIWSLGDRLHAVSKIDPDVILID